MADFIKSLHVGLGAAKTAEENRAEIDAVFQELNRQLAEATEGKVQIRRAEFRKGLTFTADFRPVMYWALIVESPYEGVKPTEIASWNMERSGYPCEIEIDSSSKWYCEDRNGLEAALGLLLQDPMVGETIQKYIRQPVPGASAST
ncbi:hypothetical protein [Burkholderia vietnamiensis]|uniref:hypothetical protein n=1 Tax=Burkholderia vietnamiensis TaxID=60552 RepID=UPI002DD4240F|nr:hypothetical protein [Burkholderia vietnamiensis]MEC4599256.1 hypothetical protein [Burkholderia vietnamiensis]